MPVRELGNAGGNPLGRVRSNGATVAVRGEILYNEAGTYTFTPPAGVTSVCAVLVGPGGPAFNNGIGTNHAGGGGALAWANDIDVIPGAPYTIIVGFTGSHIPPDSQSQSQSTSAFGMVADRGVTYTGSSTVGTGAPTLGVVGKSRGGGTGGTNQMGDNTGGGGAGGYSGNGGTGRAYSGTPVATAGAGGGGGGGGNGGAGGGGVGIYGQGSNGIAGAASGSNTGGGGGGSGGSNGRQMYEQASRTGDYGGGQGIHGSATSIGRGAVRIIWGAGRAFPSTDVGPS